MTQTCKVTFGNISTNQTLERVFDSKNQAFIWLNHQLCRECSKQNIHELYFRIESYNHSEVNLNVLPF